MADQFEAHQSGLNSPAFKASAVTPDNGNDLAVVARGLYIGGAGDVVVLCAGDVASVTFVGVPAGSILPVRAKRVYSTNTTATNIIALI